jgi:flavin-dependent dehydrogenase
LLEAKPAAGTGICCTGIISAECYKRFVQAAGLRARPAGAARLFSPGEGEIRVSRDIPPAFVIDRPAFDSALATRAIAAGVVYRFSCRVTGVTENVNGCVVSYQDRDGGHELSSEAVVLACGFSSDLTRRAGLGRIGAYRAGAQADVECQVNEVEVYFDPGLFPGGFGWLVPTWDGRGLLGVVTQRNAGVALEVILRRLRTQRRVGLKLTETRSKALPLRPLARTAGKRIFVAGEAAGQVKATTFGGIYTGLLAAEEAAASITRALSTGTWKPGFADDYERAWRKLMMADLNMGWHARRVYDALSVGQVDRIFALVRSTGLDRQLLASSDVSFDWHGALLGRLLSRPRLMAGLISVGTLGIIPDLLAILTSRRKHV